jgi:hypothetical protein
MIASWPTEEDVKAAMAAQPIYIDHTKTRLITAATVAMAKRELDLDASGAWVLVYASDDPDQLETGVRRTIGPGLKYWTISRLTPGLYGVYACVRERRTDQESIGMLLHSTPLPAKELYEVFAREGPNARGVLPPFTHPLYRYARQAAGLGPDTEAMRAEVEEGRGWVPGVLALEARDLLDARSQLRFSSARDAARAPIGNVVYSWNPPLSVPAGFHGGPIPLLVTLGDGEHGRPTVVAYSRATHETLPFPPRAIVEDILIGEAKKKTLRRTDTFEETVIAWDPPYQSARAIGRAVKYLRSPLQDREQILCIWCTVMDLHNPVVDVPVEFL